MNFSKALDEIKHGEKLCRAGWNGKGMWVAYTIPSYGETVTQPYVFLHAADGQQVPWTPSQTDLFAEDWQYAE